MIAAARHFVLFVLLVACRPASAVVIPDPAFGNAGIVTMNGYSGAHHNSVQLAVTADHGIVMAMSGMQADTPYLAIVKLHSEGDVDTAFGGGLQQLPLDNSNQLTALSRLLALPDGGVLVFLRPFVVSDGAVATLIRLDATGRPSAAFNSGRPLLISLPALSGAWTAYLHGDGFLLASVPQASIFNEPDESAARRRPRFFRVTATGLLDPGFGQSGYREELEQDGLFGDVIVLQDQRFQILHSVKLVNGRFVNRWRRYLPDGRMDGSNGTGGWIDVGDDGSLQLVNAFALSAERSAVVSSRWRFAGYVDGEGRTTTQANYLNPVKTIVPFGADRALVGIRRDSYLIPTEFDGSFVVAIDANGVADGSFVAPGQTSPVGMLRVSRINQFNVVADSSSTFVVANYNRNNEFYVVRYREIPDADHGQPIPATHMTTLLLLATIVLAATVRHRYRTTQHLKA